MPRICPTRFSVKARDPGHTMGGCYFRGRRMDMNTKNITMGVMGMAAVGAAAMLLMPKKNRRMKKALKSVGAAVNTISNMIG